MSRNASAPCLPVKSINSLNDLTLMKVSSLLLKLSLPALLLAACHTMSREEPETAPGNWNVLGEEALASSHGRIDFVTHVRPILEWKCVPCHSRTEFPMFSLENRRKAFEGGPLGKRIIPGEPNESALVAHIASTHKSVLAMPPVGNRLTPDEVRILTAWIKQGAPWPSGKPGNLTPHLAPEP